MGKSVQDNNRLYNFLSPLVQFGTRCHYQRFDVHGLDHLPTDGAYIVAPCHQQALMEPLAVLNFVPKPPVFLARADIFNNKVVRTLLTFLKILPVYRIRDGKDNLSKNTDIFDKSRDVLLDGFPLCLMAEGRHNDKHHLLPLAKGMFRIAGETQLRLGEHPLYIVPTGIDFDDYELPYSNLVVNIGEPIPVKPFMETYVQNEPLALNQMRDTLADALRAQMHDIKSLDHYDDVLTVCHVANPLFRQRNSLEDTAWNRFRMRCRLAGRMDEMESAGDSRFSTIADAAAQLRVVCSSLHLKPRDVAEHWNGMLTAVYFAAFTGLVLATIFSPWVRYFLFFVLVCYPVPFIPTHLVTKHLVKDSQFRSSFNFGIRFFFSIIYAIAIGIVMACCGGAWMAQVADIGAWWGLIAVGVVHVMAIAAGPLVSSLRALAFNVRYWLLRIFRRNDMRQIDALIDTIGNNL